jgi:LysM repeat protein
LAPVLAILAAMMAASLGGAGSMLPKRALASRTATPRAPLTPGPEAAEEGARLTVSPLRAHPLGSEEGTIPAIRSYTVRPGDTIDIVAARLGLHPQTIVWANPELEGGTLKPGQVLVAPPVDGVLHQVERGETADGLAQAYGVAAPTLLQYNGLQSADQVRPGLRLLIPGSRPPVKLPLVGGGELSVQSSDYDAFPGGWCTWYVAERRDIPWTGDAWTWYQSAQAAGWSVGQQPRPGAIMVSWESQWYGHVAYVEKVLPDGGWVVSEMNYQQFGAVDYRAIAPGSIPLIGFIY